MDTTAIKKRFDAFTEMLDNGIINPDSFDLNAIIEYKDAHMREFLTLCTVLDYTPLDDLEKIAFYLLSNLDFYESN